MNPWGLTRRHRAARILLSLATAFWLWFGIGSAWAEKLGLINWAMRFIIPGGLLLIALLVARRWSFAGGALSALEGLLAMALILWAAVTGRYSPEATLAMTLALALPLLAAGALPLFPPDMIAEARP